MPVKTWTKSPVAVVQGYDSRHPQKPLDPLVLWAAWAVDGLHYLADLDEAFGGTEVSVQGHHPDVIDIAHVRWATGTAITALDLCAAALARCFCGWIKPKELDLRNFDPQINPADSAKLRARLPAPALDWVNAVLADARYSYIQGARNPLAHSRMSRQLFLGGNGGHETRTHFVLPGSSAYGARQLVTDSKDLVGDHFNAFLLMIDGM